MHRLAARQNIIIYIFALCGFVLIAKSAQLQIFNPKYQDQAERTTLDKNVVYPARGMMYDRKGRIMVANAPIYDLQVIYNNLKPTMDTSLLCSLLEIDKETFTKNITKNWKDPRFSKAIPFTFRSKIPIDVFSKFQEHLYQFPGFYPVTRNIRTYPHKSAAHVMGYLSEVTNEDIRKGEGSYQNGDLKGEIGLEEQYEEQLRGEKGIEYLLKDNLGREVGSFEGGRLDSSAISGEDVMLSLDLELQAYTEYLMQNKRGAVIAIEPSTGEILTMVSAPMYDPNLLSFSRERDAAYKSLSNDKEDLPMINRALSAAYPPGSIFKPIFSLIALQFGITTPTRNIYCTGVHPVTNQKCHARVGSYNLPKAIQYSCNGYYFRLLEEFVNQYGRTNPGRGMDSLVVALERFGLNKKLGIDYPFEKSGNIPDSKYFDEVYRVSAPNGWRSTYITSLGIGQGEFQFTTLQMANMAAAVANRGYYIKPHFIKNYMSGSKNIPSEFLEKISVGIDQQHYGPVIEGMRRAVTGGTSVVANIDGIEVCAKTGTSENGLKNVDNLAKDHSVFICFAPKDNPKIAIATYVENAGFGATYAGAISSLMLEKYLKGEISNRRKYLEKKMVESNLLNKVQL